MCTNVVVDYHGHIYSVLLGTLCFLYFYSAWIVDISYRFYWLPFLHALAQGHMCSRPSSVIH